jgi:glyoxylase-like metal-dependent hydrolase (beta-lactamase superfamily II)
MIIERTEHPDWLTNAYLVADAPGGSGVLIDANAVLDPLIEQVARDEITITHILLTHHHMDHVAEIERYRRHFDAPVVAHPDTAGVLGAGAVDELIGDGAIIESGNLTIQAIDTPGHCAGHLAFLVGLECFTSDVLFRGTVGGTRSPGGNYANLRRSIMERLMTLPPETGVHPGHKEPTSIGDEWDYNPFIRLWRGLEPETAEQVHVKDVPATLLLWAPDYDGGHKALVQFEDGERAIVGGSQIVR